MNLNDQRVIQSRDTILDAAVSALLRNPEASFSEIAQLAGIGRATLYRHFETRERLVETLARQCLARTNDALAPMRHQRLSGRAAIAEGVRVLLPMADRYHFLLNLPLFVSNDPQLTGIWEGQLFVLTAVMNQAKTEGSIDTEVPTEWAMRVFDSLIYAAWNLYRDRSQELDAAHQQVVETFFTGVSSPSGYNR